MPWGEPVSTDALRLPLGLSRLWEGPDWEDRSVVLVLSAMQKHLPFESNTNIPPLPRPQALYELPAQAGATGSLGGLWTW